MKVIQVDIAPKFHCETRFVEIFESFMSTRRALKISQKQRTEKT